MVEGKSVAGMSTITLSSYARDRYFTEAVPCSTKNLLQAVLQRTG